MSIRHLRTLLAIAERGSFAAAARDVHLTESAVSMQMKALEEELGVVLFDRTTRPPALTEAGRALIPEAEELVRGYERLVRPKDEDARVEGHLRLGAVPSIITGILPGAIAALRRKHPGMHVEIAMALSAELVERLERRSLDAVIVSELGKVPSGFVWSPFAREPLVLIAPPDAPNRPAGELLASYPFIRYTRQAWVGRLIHTMMKRRRIKVAEAMTLDTLEAVTAMVSHGLGVSIVPQRGRGVPLAFPVRTVALPEPTVHRVVGLLRAESHSKALLADALLAELARLAGGDLRKPGSSSKKLKT
ncbi:MAG: LysR family transcriptional regulator [Hyphomicrobiaceae bacterium]|nr:MAG: LysR family transcriptional regulator [Hyphomicrobiaceae bacterium]